MPDLELTCYKAGCRGDFAYRGNASGDTLYKCVECGATIDRKPAERVASGDGYAAGLAQVLLDGGGLHD